MTQKRTTENNLPMSGNAAAATRRKTTRPRAKRATPAEAPAVSVSAGPEIVEPVPVLSEIPLSASTEESPVAATVPGPIREKIAKLAYSYWEARGRKGGSPEEDWLRAEMVICGSSSATV
jgi:Protein of unknown function (DUF2934)